ncbi:hypothetical protein JCM17823_18600 [Halorubrum gandharaense]
MIADALPTWFVVASAAGGIGALALAWFLREHRGKPGVDWFFAVFGAQALWCLAYAVGLLVSDPAVSEALETLVWVGIIWTGVAFLGFALEYSGRADVAHGTTFHAVLGFGVLSTAVLLTNSFHGAFWTGFSVESAFGLPVGSYAFGPWAYLVIAVLLVLVASAVFLLVDTLLSYGPLYRAESAAVALSPLPPGLALVAWALGVGPATPLQLAPLMFVPHVLLDGYAFGRAEMFERNPTTSRAAERTAIDDLTDPVLALALDRRIVRLNPAAESLLGVDAQTARDRPIDEFLEVTVEPDVDAQLTVNSAAGRRTYAVSTARLTDPNDTHVGYTVVLTDVTERERRRQQLEVFNRILRHNLRNDAGVVHGYAELLVEQVDDPELAPMVDAVERRSRALRSLGEKAATVDDLLGEAKPTTASLAGLVQRAVDDVAEAYPDADVRVDAESDVTASFREAAVLAMVENLVENALEHHDGKGVEREDGGPWVRIRVGVDETAEGRTATLSVSDDGPGVPDHEIEAVESGQETALEHGSGLGMWVVAWAADALGATVEYADRTPRGTTVTVRLPVETATTTD